MGRERAYYRHGSWQPWWGQGHRPVLHEPRHPDRDPPSLGEQHAQETQGRVVELAGYVVATREYSKVQCTDLVICIVIPGQCTHLTLYVLCIHSMLILGLYVLNVYIRETECQNVYLIVKHTNIKRPIFCKNQEYKKK